MSEIEKEQLIAGWLASYDGIQSAHAAAMMSCTKMEGYDKLYRAFTSVCDEEEIPVRRYVGRFYFERVADRCVGSQFAHLQ